MKTLVSNFTMTFILFFAMTPFLLFSQQVYDPNLQLRSESGQLVSFDKIIDAGQKTIVIFWNSNKKKHFDYLDQLNDEMRLLEADSETQIVAICSDKYHSPQQLRTLIAGNSWEFEIYVDVNETFMRANSLHDNLNTLVYQNAELLTDADIIPGLEEEPYRLSLEEFILD